MKVLLITWGILVLSMPACTGTLDDPLGPDRHSPSGDPAAGEGEGVSPGVPGTRPPLCSAAGSTDRAGPRLLRRLTKVEFEATMRNVFGLDQSWSSSLPPDSAAQNGFTNQVDQLSVGDGFAERLLETSESLGAAISEPARISQVLPCFAQGDEACAGTYLDTIGRRLYRRSLTDQERARFLDLRQSMTSQGGSFSSWVKWTTVALVSSPHAIYRSELGEPAREGTYVLTGQERATALAYTFTGAPPEEALLKAAEEGKLDDAAGLHAAARALMLDEQGRVRPGFRVQFLRFANQWLGLSALDNRQKDPEVFPDWSDAVRVSMRLEIEAFLQRVLIDEQGGMQALLTAPYTLLDGTLAKFYGYGSANSTEFVLTPRPQDWGVGLLSQGAILAIKSTNRDTSPTQRGHFVRDRVLCFEVPPPPPTVGQIPAPTGNETTRERYERVHAANPACASCHKLMDPIGFGFERLDATGRFRETEGGLAIDTSGSVAPTAASEKQVAFIGPSELADELAQREAAGACFGAYFSSFAFGLDRNDTSCLVESARLQLGQGKVSALDFMLGLVSAAHFTSRVDG